MARPEWRDAAKERVWRGRVRDWQRSGLTIREFCARRGLAEHNFHAWRRTLAQRDYERRDDERPAAPRTATPAFMPVTVVGEPPVREPAALHGAALEIVLPGGVVVRVRAGVDDATLRRVLAALTETPSC